ncbi:MAG: winged helix-turn-helix transcriptional regulator [Candidatus Hodarchaeota archaeon]
MDAIDKGILQHLIANCRITYRELATIFNLSSNAVKKRVKKLEETGIIKGYRIDLSPAMVGTNHLFGMLATDGSRDEAEFIEELGSDDKIIAAASYTGGNYALVAEFREPRDLWNIGAHIRSFDCVKSIETHQLLTESGSTMKFSALHIRVLKTLIDDPRKSIVDIANQSGLSARRVRKLVNDLVESQAIRFSVYLGLGARGSIPFLMRITLDERSTDYQTMISWLKETFSNSVWEIYTSVEAPVLIVLLTGETLQEVDTMARTTRRHEHVPSVIIHISKHHNYFPSLRTQALQKLIEEVAD